jgi:hypothetical protein
MNQLEEILSKLSEQNDLLKIVRSKYLAAEACRKHYEARMIAIALGKSNAEKLVNAQATESWRKQAVAIASLESDFEFERLKFSILEREYQAVYFTLKLDSETIRKS